jgi:hypothetical protein
MYEGSDELNRQRTARFKGATASMGRRIHTEIYLVIRWEEISEK